MSRPPRAIDTRSRLGREPACRTTFSSRGVIGEVSEVVVHGRAKNAYRASRSRAASFRSVARRHGYPTDPDAPLFCTREGARWNESNVRERILAAATERATTHLVQRGLPPLPHVSPHTLRRTYVSMMLLATNFDVPYVQSQVGHADSKMTMDVYAQLLDRSKRDHGAASTPSSTPPEPAPAPSKTGFLARPLGHRLGHQALRAQIASIRSQPEKRLFPGKYPMGAAGFEPATSRV